MRIRSRNLDQGGVRWFSTLLYTQKSNGANFGPYPSSGSGSSTQSFRTKSETMTDELQVVPDGPTRAKERLRRKELTRMLKDIRLHSSDMSFLGAGRAMLRNDLQVHRCTHTKTRIRVNPDFAMKSRAENGTYIMTKAHTFCNGAFATRLMGTGSNVINSGLWASKKYTADGYRTPDWFALLEQFNDASNSIIPSSSLLGESLVEHDIFIDAVKAVINPSSLVKTFIKRFRSLGIKSLRRITLGQVRKVAKDGSSAYLGYQFAVKPAVEEVVKVLTAHTVVSQRLNYLRQNGGNYVPVRVRGKLPSNVENQTLPLPGPFNYGVYCDWKETVGTIGGWARVREDLNFGATWDAYLQYFGIKRIAELAWELVPMSFVVDWFTNAQDYVHKYFSPPNVNPFYDLRMLCHSLKEEISETLYVGAQYYFQEDGFVTTLPSEAFPVASKISTNYTRHPSLPKSSGSVDFSNLGLFHKITLGVMLLQKKL